MLKITPEDVIFTLRFPSKQRTQKGGGLEMKRFSCNTSTHRIPRNLPSKEELQKRREAAEERQTPLPNNRCKTEGCAGEIVASSFRVSYGYKVRYLNSRCSKCGRHYLNAKNPRVLKISFEEMNKPMTI